jgi:PTS system nitrogen regulatory IIA component
MDIKEFLSPTDVLVDVQASDKSRLLENLVTRAASALKQDADAITDQILKREALGSTGIGSGVALPHARIHGLKRPFGILARLRKPIDFDAIDGEPVDLVFLLLLPAAPEGEQLNALACVARKLRDKEVLREVRNAAHGVAVHHTMVT